MNEVGDDQMLVKCPYCGDTGRMPAWCHPVILDCDNCGEEFTTFRNRVES